MKKEVRSEVKQIINALELNCKVTEFKDKVDWGRISEHQTLSEDFIREFKDKVDWGCISAYQTLSEDFIREFKKKINIKIYEEVHRKQTYEEKLKEVKKYCKKYNLEFKGTYFYAFREHDKLGKGKFNKTKVYTQGYYKDWHLDMRRNEENSFGLGIFPKGNTKVKVLVSDWGVEVYRKDGKARVWGFEIEDDKMNLVCNYCSNTITIDPKSDLQVTSQGLFVKNEICVCWGCIKKVLSHANDRIAEETSNVNQDEIQEIKVEEPCKWCGEITEYDYHGVNLCKICCHEVKG